MIFSSCFCLSQIFKQKTNRLFSDYWSNQFLFKKHELNNFKDFTIKNAHNTLPTALFTNVVNEEEKIILKFISLIMSSISNTPTFCFFCSLIHTTFDQLNDNAALTFFS